MTYICTSTGLVVLDGLGVLNVRELLAEPLAPLAVVALVWFYLLPPLIWRWNKCGGCQRRMARKLVSGPAPKPAPMSIEPSAASRC